MNLYRITTATYYDGCIPVTVYVVQKRVDSFLCDKWINIKGYDCKSKAVYLLNLLKGGKK